MQLTPTELTVLEWAMPTGIIARRYIYGTDAAQTRRLRAAFSALVNAGALSEHVIWHDTTTGRDHKRYYITPTGFRALVDALPDEHPLKQKIDPCSIRTGLNAASQNRLARQADAKTVLAGIGVDDMYSLLANGQNPFCFFGDPTSDQTYYNAYDPTSPNYIDQVMARLITDAKAAAMTMDFAGSPHPFFMPIQYMHINNKYTNNALGVIVDFRDTTVCVVFKNLIDNTNMYWNKRAYSLMLAFSSGFFRHGFAAPVNSRPHNALLFLDQASSLDTLLDTIITQPPKDFPDPFSVFIPIVLREPHPHGIPLLRQLMQFGLQALYRREQMYIMDCYPCLEYRSPYFDRLYYGRKKILIGTILNLYQISSYAKSNSDDYWICYQDQVTLYERFVPHDHIISIPRHD